MEGIAFKEIDIAVLDQVKEIYKKESWYTYLKDDAKLIRAFNNSLFILGAFDNNNKLIGFVRCVGDAEHVVLVQDLIIDPEYQKRGIGTYLFEFVMKKYAAVRMFMVVTDISDVVTNNFYPGFKFKKLEDKDMIAYVRE